MWESVADPNIYRAVNVLNGVKTNPWLRIETKTLKSPKWKETFVTISLIVTLPDNDR